MENAEKEGWGKGWTNKGSEEEERWTHITKILQNSPRDGLSQDQKTLTWRPIGTLSPAARSLKNQRCPVQIPMYRNSLHMYNSRVRLTSFVEIPLRVPIITR